MAQVYGYNTWLGWGEESTYATAVSAAKYLEIEKESIKDDGSRFEYKPLLRFRSQNRKIIGKANPGGAFSFPVPWTGAEQIFKHALGAVSTSAAAPTYTHTFSLAAQPPTGLTMFINRDSEALTGSTCFRVSGCRVNKFTLRQAVGEWLMADVEVMGAKRDQTTRPTPTFPTFDCIDWSMVALKVIQSGTPIDLPVRSFELTIENGLHADGYRLGSRFRQLLGAGDSQRKVTFKLELEYNDNAVYAFYRDLTDAATLDLKFTWRKDPTNATASNTNPELALTLPRVTLDGEDPTTEGSGPKYLNVTGTAQVSSADNDEVGIVWKNGSSAV